MTTKTFLYFGLLLCLISCSEVQKKNPSTNQAPGNFINPPLAHVNVPYQEYTVYASKGDTLFYKTGSIILIEPNSFVDKAGNIIQGSVQVKYREFSDPLDFYLSGIPMNYDSAGKSYNFESSGMFEILANKDGVPVLVNPKSKLEIYLKSIKDLTADNLYYLDTIKQKWLYQENGIEKVTANPNNKTQRAATEVNAEWTEPLKPEKANNKSPVIKIIIDPASFKELLVYDNLQFQIDESEKKFNPKDTSEEWSNVELVRGSRKGIYTVKFSNAKRSVSCDARPVLEGKDYDKALTIFNQKQIEYNSLKKKRVAGELALKGKYRIDSLAYAKKITQINKRTEKLNRLIDARNRVIEKQNLTIAEINKGSNDYLTFFVDRSGFWNCDIPFLPELIPITADFVDKNGKITLTHIAVFCKNFNSIFRYRDNYIRVVNNRENMIVGIVNGDFAYLSYEDYRKLGITENTKQQTFLMTIISEKEYNYENLKVLNNYRQK